MSDAAGLAQFMSALGEIARGARHPLAPPIWRGELLNARDPPRVTFMHGGYKEVFDIEETIVPFGNMVQRSFFFRPNELALIHAQIPYHLHQSALPDGYCGSAFAFPMAVTTARKIRKNPLGYALELVKKLKGEVTEEYMHSLADFMAIKGRPPFKEVGSYLALDVTGAGFGDVDFGWGKAVYDGPACAVKVASFYIPYKNAQGQDGLIIPLCLPGEAMERFAKELDTMLKTRLITSSL